MFEFKREYEVALATLVKRVWSLFGGGHALGGGRLEWREIEELLTDGYALALALEGERDSIHRSIFELESAGEQASASPEAARLRSLGAGFVVIKRDIRLLRSLLDQVHVQGKRFRGRLDSHPMLTTRYGGIRVDERWRRKVPV